MNRPVLAVAAILLAHATVGLAGVVTYTDRATWQAAVGTPTATFDFESFATDTSFNTTPLDVGPFTLSSVGGQGLFNFVDVTPFSFPPVSPAFGNAAVNFFVQDPLAAGMAFHTPVSSFFADFLYAGNGPQLTLTLSLSGGGTFDLHVPGAGTGLESFGFVSTIDTVTSIRFHNSANDGFMLDNVALPGQLPGTVPEPATFVLSGLGAIWIARYRRRK